MTMGSDHHPASAGGLGTLRAAGVLAGSAGIAGVAWWLAQVASGDVGRWGANPPTIDALVATGAAATGALACAWLAVGVVITVAQALGGTLHRRSMLPSGLRTVVIWAVGAGLTVAAMAPAAADTRVDQAAATANIATAATVDLGWVPSQPTTDQPAAPTPAPAETAPPVGRPDGSDQTGSGDRSVRVVRGDTLWDIASRHLGERASNAEVAQEWGRWYAANLDTIGPDPDLILPGQVLRPPA